MTNRAVACWTDWSGDGLELCVLEEQPDGLTIEGTVVSTRGGWHGCTYLVRTDRLVRTRSVEVWYPGGVRLHLICNGNGQWRDALRDEALPELEGCTDVDIGVTPATNTLPIRRLQLVTGESRDIAAAYVPLPSESAAGPDARLLPQRAAQRYTCLEVGRRYRYEGLFRGFAAVLEVDAAGLVLDYPDTFRRRVLQQP